MRVGQTADGVFKRLLEGILGGEFPAGSVLREARLARQWEVSRTPLREAMRRAAEAGLVTLRANQAPKVRALSAREAAELHALWRILELHALVLAWPRLTQEDLRPLRALADEAAPGIMRDWPRQCLKFDAALHALWQRRCGNTWLQADLERHFRLLQLGPPMSGGDGAQLAGAYAGNVALLDALEKRDLPAALAGLSAQLGSPDGLDLLAAVGGAEASSDRRARLVLEAGDRGNVRQSRSAVVSGAPLPVALFSNLNILASATPRFFGSLLGLVRDRLEADGQPARLYTGRYSDSQSRNDFSCPELMADAEAGHLAGILALASGPRDPSLARLQQQGLPVVEFNRSSPLGALLNPCLIPAIALPYLVAAGRRRIGLIGWELPGADGHYPLADAFAGALEAKGLPCHPEWCRVDTSYACAGAGWEAFREIWFAAEAKPDALVVADENYLPEIIMAVLQIGVRVPEDLLVISHQTRGVALAPAVPVARIEEDISGVAELLTDHVRAALAGRPAPPVPAGLGLHRLVPLVQRGNAMPAPGSIPTTRGADEQGHAAAIS